MKIVLRYSLLWSILLLAFVLRLYRIDYPILDWHSFRQVDTVSVTREYIKNGVDILRPQYHDLSNIQSGKDNLEGYRMVEFPLINAFTASLIRTVPILPLEATSRFISVLFSLGTMVAIFYLVKELSGKKVAYLSTLVFAVTPYIVYYSRSALPEPALVFFSTTSLATFVWGTRKNHVSSILISILTLSIALLLKPFVIFLAPVYLAISAFEYKKDLWKKWFLYLFILAPLPLLWWRSWITQFPTGIPASDWLFNGDGIRFRPAWFRWLFYERFTKMFLGFTGLFFFPLLLKKVTKDIVIYASWWLGILIYISILATGNVRHDYYQFIATPIYSITLGYGIHRMYEYISTLKIKNITKNTKHILGITVCALLFISSVTISLHYIRGFFNVNNWEYVEAGKRVDELVPHDALVIAPAFGDTSFLFQTNRRGWPIGFEISDKINKGATHYVSTSYDDEARDLEKKYFILEKTEKYIIIDLTKQKNS